MEDGWTGVQETQKNEGSLISTQITNTYVVSTCGAGTELELKETH